MIHSHRAKTNMTTQLKAQLCFYQRDLSHEKTSLKKAKTFLRYNLPGVKSMVKQHQAGVNKTLKDMHNLKRRIRMRQRNGQIYKIL